MSATAGKGARSDAAGVMSLVHDEWWVLAKGSASSHWLTRQAVAPPLVAGTHLEAARPQTLRPPGTGWSGAPLQTMVASTARPGWQT